MKKIFSAEAPANIALIKYMGKVKGAERNRPTNPSFSYTLSHLVSRVEIESIEGAFDKWSPLTDKPWIRTDLSDRGRKRYLAHFEFLKQKMQIEGHFEVRSANNFPSDCGIASSASSFAALTLATYEIAKEQNSKVDLSINKLAELSRIGSGSSIRSFMAPFVLWDENGVASVDLPYPEFIHQTVIVDREKKAIGSSDAHERVTSSLLFKGRPERARARLDGLLKAFRAQNWREAYEITWAEFWDMHALFSTSAPPFHYIQPQSLNALNIAVKYWEKENDGPLVTMDAGANIHFLYRDDQADAARKISQILTPEFEVISSGSKDAK